MKTKKSQNSRFNVCICGRFSISFSLFICVCTLSPADTSRSKAAEKFLQAFRIRSGDAFSQHSLLAELEHTHPHLYHYLLSNHFEELAVAIIGRGVTAGCLRYGDIPKKRGAWHLSIKDLGTVYQQLKSQIDHLALEHGGLLYRVIVVSDGEVMPTICTRSIFSISCGP